MRRTAHLPIFIIALAILGAAILTGEASAITVKVSINGQVKTCSANPCTLSSADVPAGANFSLQSGQVGWNDGGQDNIDLSNLEITATANDASGTIIFWADDFTSPPNADAQNAVGFYHKGKGTLTNGASTQGSLNSWVRLTGSLNDDDIVGPYSKTVYCSIPVSCGNFNINPPLKETWFSLSGNRKMQGKLEFLLKTNGHKLKLNDNNVPQSIFSGAPATGKNKDAVMAEHAERLGEERPRPLRWNCDKSAPVLDGFCVPR